MPLHTFDHPYNTKYKKDPAIERWVHQRYYGQFGKFVVHARAVNWLTALYVVVPAYLYYVNELGVKWADNLRAENINAIRMGR